jgi:predicted hydrocarbon binding protein
MLEKTEFYDSEGEWRIAGSDWLLMSGSTLRSWAKITELILGSNAKVILFMAGKRSGEQFTKTLLDEGLKVKDLKYALEIFLTNGGWGRVRVKLNFQKQMATVRILNSVMTRQTEAKEPVCHFIGGYIAGALGVAFNKEVECVEMKCRTKGDAFCEFRVNGSNSGKSVVEARMP